MGAELTRADRRTDGWTDGHAECNTCCLPLTQMRVKGFLRSYDRAS